MHGPFVCILGIISILSNIIVLGIFIKYKALRTPTNAVIINLALTDIGVSSIGYPMSAASDLHGSWKFGYTGCQVSGNFGIKQDEITDSNLNVFLRILRTGTGEVDRWVKCLLRSKVTWIRMPTSMEKLRVAVHTFNSSLREEEAGR